MLCWFLSEAETLPASLAQNASAELPECNDTAVVPAELALEHQLWQRLLTGPLALACELTLTIEP